MYKMMAAVIVSSFIFINGGNYAQEDSEGMLSSEKTQHNGRILGAVLSGKSAHAVHNATVQLQDIFTHEVYRSTSTKGRAIFALEGIEPGNYFLNISHVAAYDHPVAISIEAGESKDIGIQYLRQYPTSTLPTLENQVLQTDNNAEESQPIDAGYPEIDGRKVLQVCEYIEMRSIQPAIYYQGVIIIGDLVQTARGQWLQQSCGNSLGVAGYTWPNAINMIKDSHYNKSKRDNASLDKVAHLFGKQHPQDHRQYERVAVIGNVFTCDALVVAPCGDGNTCGFGYGPISAPAQITYSAMRYLDTNNEER